uniref:Macoilin n=1 Tax=Cacopsylla melanoneura TaxID=428564 RepID=A0A8D9E1T4_9HEMI
MKRRNGDCAKIRRQVRKANRSLDDTYDSMLFISKTLAFWMITFTMDHFLHCRLEFFWYLWYLARNINSSYTQSLGLSLVFVCIAFTSDLLCYFFIPVQYLFFAASTWVWVHYIYNNERGLTPSTLILYFIIILLESSVKFKPEHRAALNINLCKPFAAHCVGFPIVTFSFSELRRNCSYFSFSLGSGGASGVKSSSQRKSSQHQSQQDLFGAFDNELSHKNSSHRKSTETQDECSAESTAGRCSSSSGTAKKSKSHHHSNHSHNSIKETILRV